MASDSAQGQVTISTVTAGQDGSQGIATAARNPKVLAEIQRAVDAANANVSRAESIRKFTVLEHDLTEASGYLTPKLSIKRDLIVKDYTPVIEEMYAGQPATEGTSLVG